MIHPDTGKIIPLPLRFAAFVPVNICIVAGMLAPTQTTTTLLFWQWANQSYNVALNHANRNASNELSNFQIAGKLYIHKRGFFFFRNFIEKRFSTVFTFDKQRCLWSGSCFVVYSSVRIESFGKESACGVTVCQTTRQFSSAVHSSVHSRYFECCIDARQ